MAEILPWHAWCGCPFADPESTFLIWTEMTHQIVCQSFFCPVVAHFWILDVGSLMSRFMLPNDVFIDTCDVWNLTSLANHSKFLLKYPTPPATAAHRSPWCHPSTLEDVTQQLFCLPSMWSALSQVRIWDFIIFFFFFVRIKIIFEINRGSVSLFLLCSYYRIWSERKLLIPSVLKLSGSYFIISGREKQLSREVAHQKSNIFDYITWDKIKEI